MRKRILSTLLALLLVLGMLPKTVGAAVENSGTFGDDLTWAFADNILTIYGHGPIPDYGHVSQPWETLVNQIRTVNIEDGITSIGEYAFYAYPILQNVSIPDSVISIGDAAFNGCSGLENINIPDSVINIGESAFSGCYSLAAITIPRGISSIGNSVFNGCSGLESINIPDSVITIDESAFRNCNNLTSIVIPNSVTTIGTEAFSDCDGLTHMTIPNSVISIGNGAFDNCSSLRHVTIPDSIVRIESDMFKTCLNLTSITIPSTVTYIGARAFRDTSLVNVYYSGSETQWKTVSIDSSNDKLSSATIHYNSTGPDDHSENTFVGTWKIDDEKTMSVNGVPMTYIFGHDYGKYGNEMKINVDHTFTYYIAVGVGGEGEWRLDGSQIIYEITTYDTKENESKALQINKICENEYYLVMPYDSLSGTHQIYWKKVNSGTGPDDPGGDTPTAGDIKFEETTYSVVKGEEIGIRAYITSDAEQLPNDYVKWSSSNEAVATVTPSNILLTTAYATVRGVSAGTTTITAITADGKSASCTVTVTPTPNEIKISGRQSLLVGNSDSLIAQIQMNTLDVTDEIIWSSSNSDVLAFDSDGSGTIRRPISGMTIPTDSKITDSITVYGRGSGEVTVTCKLASGAEKTTEVFVYRDNTKGFQKIEKEFELAFKKYLKNLQQFVNKNKSVVTDAQVEEQAQKLMEQDSKGSAKLVTFDPKYSIDETTRLNVYKAVAQFLADNVAHQFDHGDIDINADKFDFGVLDQVYGMIDISPHSYKYGDVRVTIGDDEGGGLSVNGAHFRKITYKEGLKSTHIADLVSTPGQVAEAIQDYVQELMLLEKDALKKAFSEVTKELFGATLGELIKGTAKEALTEALGPYADALEQSGAGKVVTAVSTAADYYKYLKTLLNYMHSDPLSTGKLPKLSFEPTSIKDKMVSAGMVGLNNLGTALDRAVEEFFTTGDVDFDKIIGRWEEDQKNGIISTIMCPVNITVYDNIGAEVGYVGDDDVWYDDNVIYIEHYGDVKTIYSRNKALRFDMIGTDSGTLNCRFEEYSNGVAVSRVNYYDIPLYDGKTLIAVVPDEALTTDNIAVTTTDSGTISADDCITSAEYATATVRITCDTTATDGGQIWGAGEYVRGDAVALIAVPETDYAFMGWQNSNGALEEISPVYEFTAKENVALTALFVKRVGSENPPVSQIYTIIFDTSGGTVNTSSATTGTDGKLSALPVPTRTGYTFDGWYTAADGGEKVDDSKIYIADTTLYAHWTKNGVTEHTHKWEAIWSSDATGHWHNCVAENCPITANSQKDSYALHISDGGKVTTEATAYQDGVRTYSCTICKYVIRTENIPATGGSHSVGSSNGGGSSSTSGGSSYSVNTPSSTPNGTVNVNPSNARKGDTVTITAVPDGGYRLEILSVTSGNKSIALIKQDSNTYTFTMPAGVVKVEASFVPDEILKTPWNNPYIDVVQGAWYYDAVQYVSENSLMDGYGTGQFGPDDTLTRAQVAQILYNKEGRPTVTGGGIFTDVAPGAWCAPAIMWAAERGIVGGYGNGMFGPDDNITREQLTVMLWRYSGSPAATSKELHFNDTDEISGFALEALRWAVENGILNGHGGGRLDPGGQATRAQAAQMLKNFIENLGESN